MGNLLDKPNKEQIGASNGSAREGENWGVTSIQGFRTEMEDQHIHVTDIPGLSGHSIYAVFDGHGGKNAAIYAAENLVTTLLGTPSLPMYLKNQDPRALGKALEETFLEVDKKMREVFAQRGPNERSGCTAVAVMLTPTHIVTANAGDSRALLSRGGANVELSFDHKPGNAGETARIVAAGGVVSFKRVDGELAVSRALGDFQYKDKDLSPEKCKVTAFPDLTIYTREPADQFIVIACDGIWDVNSNEDVIKSVTNYAEVGERNPQLMCEELLEECLVKQSKDNMSAIIVLLQAADSMIGPGDGIKGLRLQRDGPSESAPPDSSR